METIQLHVDKNVDNSENYAQAVNFLNNREVVAFPTETVYGLGAVATDDVAVKKIFAAKGRPSDNPLIVHIGTFEEVELYTEQIPDVAKKCMAAFWPGPLTLILQAKPNVLAPSVMAGLQSVGIRMPNHPVALQLLQTIKKPLAAPSANRSGKPSPTKASHVFEDLSGLIPCILDGGMTGIGVESTVLDVTLEQPVILRPGGVTKEMLEQVIGPVLEPNFEQQKIESTPKAPGMKYTHYAPNAPVYLIEPDEQLVQQALQQLKQANHQVALLAPQSFETFEADHYFSLGDKEDMQQMSARLYDALRACDKTEATIILATATTKKGVGTAIMNRLEKAAGGKWYTTTEFK
ncbi:threonylcarbamoyl-AMP synthase [Lysinibacillus sp. 2017]|uniref:L-threonylcarbamoyladenylate synthase n=1 Tax=unclassified Lysinibacillus TaxID=2636778 RepID=UPI000D526DAA|nr:MULTISPECIES: L-threonylcarbamoyladenylate synthase [unclassified Lysinibacillus]AWE06292.1 threonylcarbamoyl-AMP synthase [Lysinibacillus sp. 2017]TGN35233.1 threonylcarbamoyl-AMP synthase [Lysinibacillus sp. S2017]